MLAVRNDDSNGTKKETVHRRGIKEDTFVDEREPFISSEDRDASGDSYLESIMPVAPSAPPQVTGSSFQSSGQAQSESKGGSWWQRGVPVWGKQQSAKADAYLDLNDSKQARSGPVLTPQQQEALEKERTKFYNEVLSPTQPAKAQEGKYYPNSIPDAKSSAKATSQIQADTKSQHKDQSQGIQQSEQKITPDSDEYLEFMTREELMEENKRLRRLVQEMTENMHISNQQQQLSVQQQQQQRIRQIQTDTRIKYVSCGHCRQWLQVPFSATIVFCPMCSKHSDASGPATTMQVNQPPQQPQLQNPNQNGGVKASAV